MHFHICSTKRAEIAKVWDLQVAQTLYTDLECYLYTPTRTCHLSVPVHCFPITCEFNPQHEPHAMDPQHCLPRALETFLKTATTSALATPGQDVVLLRKHYLRVSSHFSGMGGAEFAFFIAGKLFDIDMRLVSSCDVTPECLRVAWQKQHCSIHIYIHIYIYIKEVQYMVLCLCMNGTNYIHTCIYICTYIYIHYISYAQIGIDSGGVVPS